MDGDTLAYLAFGGVTLVWIADDIFGFLSKGWNDLLLGVVGIAVVYFVVKSAVKQALKEHESDKF